MLTRLQLPTLWNINWSLIHVNIETGPPTQKEKERKCQDPQLCQMLYVNPISYWTRRNENLPWFTNSEGVLALPAMACGSRIWLVVLIEDMLPWDWTALFSISHVLVVQKSSEILGFFNVRPWFFNPFDGASTEVVNVGLV